MLRILAGEDADGKLIWLTNKSFDYECSGTSS